MEQPITPAAGRNRLSWREVLRHRLAQNTGAYLIGQIIQGAAGLLLLPLWAHYLSLDDYAITGTLAAFSVFLQLFLLLGLHGAAGKQYIDLQDDTKARSDYLLSVMAFECLVAGAIVVGLHFSGQLFWRPLTGSPIPFSPYVRVMLWTTYFTGLAVIPNVVLQHQHRAKLYVTLQLATFGVLVVGNLLLVVALRKGAWGAMISQESAAAFSVVCLLACFAPTLRRAAVRWRYVRMALGYGLPLVVHGIAGAVMFMADRAILEKHVTEKALGLYNFAMILGSVMNILGTGVNMAWTPYYLSLMKNDSQPHPKVFRSVTILLPALTVVALIGILFAGELCRLFFSDKYWGAAPMAVPIIFGYLVQSCYFFAVAPFFFYDNTRILGVVTTIAACANVAANIWLIPRWGGMGSAWIAAATQAFILAWIYALARRRFAERYATGRLAAMVAALFLLTVLVSLVAVPLLIKLLILAVFAWLVWVTLIAPRGAVSAADAA